MSPLLTAITVAASMGIACAALSLFIVLRRWAFIGEGIAHAGFGGAGTAWMLSLLFPSAAFLAHPAGIYAVAVAFCLAVGLGIGRVTRRRNVHTDTAIGIFLVASLAWGFTAFGAYSAARGGLSPPQWSGYLLGQMSLLDTPFVLAAIALSAAVLLVVAALGREIVACCFDPELAEITGVRAGFIHYLLITLVTVMIVLGMRLMGSLLITALLVLPGATGLLVGRRFGVAMGASLAVGLVGAVAGPLVNHHWPFIPEGPAIVLSLVAQFAAVYAWKSLRPLRRRSA